MWVWIEQGSKAGGGALVFILIPFIVAIGSIVMGFKSKGIARIFPFAFGIIWSVAIIATITTGLINVYKEKTEREAYHQSLGNSQNLVVEVSNKINEGTDNFIFPITFQNNTLDRIVGCDMEVAVCNYRGTELLKFDITEMDCFENQETSYRYSIRVDDPKKAKELYNTAYEYLEIHITLKRLNYNKGGQRYEFDEKRTIKTVDMAKLESAYADAVADYHSGNYSKAIKKFSVLGTYQESDAYIEKSYQAIQQQELEATQKAMEAIYQEAMAMYREGKYEEAIANFNEIADYKDSQEMTAKCEAAIKNETMAEIYASAKELYSQKKYSEAYWLFHEIKEYSDSQAYMTAIVDEVAEASWQYAEQGNYQSAYDLLEDMGYSIYENNPNYVPIMKAYYYASSRNYKEAVRYGLTKVVLPEGKTEVGGFQDCVGLVEVVMPDTVTVIANDAFNGCTSLTTLTLSSNIKKVGMNAFSNCDSLERIILPSSLESFSVKGLNSFGGEIHYAGTVEQWASVTKEHLFMATLNKTIYCSDGRVEP